MTKSEILGQVLKNARIEKHRTQDQMSILMDVSPSTISLWESGKRDINAMDMFKWCDVLNYSFVELTSEYKIMCKSKGLDI